MKTYKIDGVEIPEDKIKELIKSNPELKEGKESYLPWRAAHDGFYFFIDSTSNTAWDREEEVSVDNFRYIMGNYFKTSYEAARYKVRQMAIGRVTHRILELNEGWEPNWRDFLQEKYYIIYDYEYLKFDWSGCSYWDRATIAPYIKSSKICDQIIEEMENDLKIIFNLNN